MPCFCGVKEIGCNHGIEMQIIQYDAVFFHYAVVIFDILADDAGFRGFEYEVFCMQCLVLHPEIPFDLDSPILKQLAYNDNLICQICKKPLITEHHRKFLDRVKMSKL